MVRKVRYESKRGRLLSLDEYQQIPPEKQNKFKQFTWFED